MARLYKIVFFLYLLQGFIYPQNQNIRFEHLTVDDGLSTGQIRCMIQDSKGFIWIGTANGLNKFDGYKFTIYKHDKNNPASLSDNIVISMLIDHLGILWIGTQKGLNKYDKNLDQFTRYKHDPENQFSISNDDIQYIYEDHSNVLWISTAQGLNIYNPDSDNFSREVLPEVVLKDIRYIYEDKNKDLWISIYGMGMGLYKYDINRKFVKRYKGSMKLRFYSKYECSKILSVPSVSYITETSTGQLLIGTYHGLNKYDRIKDCFKSYFFDKHDRMGNYITQIVEDNSGDIWIGTAKGVHKIYKKSLNQQKLIYEKFYASGKNLSNLSSDAIYTILFDISGTMWIGTSGGGINKYSRKGNKFITLKKTGNDPKGLSSNFVNCFYISKSDNNNKIWIGTNQGLNKLDRETKVFKQFKHDPQNPYSLRNNNVTSIYPDTVNGRSVLWLGTWDGVKWFDIQSEKFYSLDDSLENPLPIKNSGVWKIIKDRRGIIWSVTANGLANYDLRDKREIVNIFSFKDSTKGKIIPNEVNTIFEDQKGIIWIGTSDGLVYFDPEIKITKYFRYDPDLDKSISHNDIFAIYEDLKGQLWIGTNFGLNKFNPETEKFDRYFESDGLPSNAIHGILEDNNGHLWISTVDGLSVFNPETVNFRNYNKYDGLQGNEFNMGASYKCPNTGELFFGGANGFNVFHPDSIGHNTYVPPIVITDFKIHNKPVPINNRLVGADSSIIDSPLEKHISESDSIILDYDQNYLSFEFSALDFNAPEKNKYSYQMEGIDPDWILTDASRRFATYTQLDPGDYVFRVKGSNNDGVWNEEGTSISIIITPPWWRTNLAYALYLIIFGFIAWSGWRFQTNKLKMKHELEIEHVHAEKLEEVDKLKSRFFANISHEFRTPLTLILGPVEQMLSGKFKGNLIEQYKIIIRNAKRLLRLINQLLDLSKLEAGKLKLQAQSAEIIFLLKGLVQAFESLAVQKNISLKFNSEIESLEAYLDIDKFEKIINNLLSNAFKFTQQGGEVEIGLSLRGVGQNTDDVAIPEKIASLHFSARNDNNEFIQITVSNTGSGIPADRVEKIFDRFYQANDSYTNDSEGTGIGLALTKELVEMHHGEISVESEKDLKTTFCILLPLGNEHLKRDEIIEEVETADRKPKAGEIPEFDDQSSELNIKEPEEHSESKSRSPIVLIVEDNSDLRKYIAINMTDKYKILEAENGKIGFEKAIHKMPDLIISDVMMPEMDGIELCKKLKTDQRTSHIPVILLTARAAKEDKIEGLETGADDFIPKPFDADELLIRVNNLIKQRRILRQKFGKQQVLNPDEIAVTSIDSSFLKRAKDIIENHLSDSAFSIDHFAGDIGLSRSQLHRKMRALTDHSATEFIRILRLQHAVALFDKDKTIAEIAYEVGFNNPTYFSDCFRKQFGQLPSDYIRTMKKNTNSVN